MDRNTRMVLPIADVVLAVILLAIFAASFHTSQEWTFRTALFPSVVSAIGCGAALSFLLFRLWAWWRSAEDEATNAQMSREAEIVNEDEDEDDGEIEYVFATAGHTAWMGVLAWVALCITLLYFTGLFIASAVFAFTYLRWGGKRSYVFATVYAVVMTTVLYAGLKVGLEVPVPKGLLLE